MHIGARHAKNPAGRRKHSPIHTSPQFLIVHLKRLILGMKIQNHTPFETTLEMEPYMAPGHATSQKMKLFGVISHQGTKEHGHYVAITKSGNEWILHNDANNSDNTNTPTLITGIRIDVQKNGTECRDGEGST